MRKLIRNLDEYRLEHKITQQQLADILGVTYVSVNRWLNGHSQPNKIQTYHIEKLLSGKGKRR
jgi:transcriptional regulator with XRE-family HTH domain